MLLIQSPMRTIGQRFSKEAAKCLEGEDEGASKHSVVHGSAPSNMTALLRMSIAWWGVLRNPGLEKEF